MMRELATSDTAGVFGLPGQGSVARALNVAFYRFEDMTDWRAGKQIDAAPYCSRFACGFSMLDFGKSDGRINRFKNPIWPAQTDCRMKARRLMHSKEKGLDL